MFSNKVLQFVLFREHILGVFLKDNIKILELDEKSNPVPEYFIKKKRKNDQNNKSSQKPNIVNCTDPDEFQVKEEIKENVTNNFSKIIKNKICMVSNG